MNVDVLVYRRNKLYSFVLNLNLPFFLFLSSFLLPYLTDVLDSLSLRISLSAGFSLNASPPFPPVVSRPLAVCVIMYPCVNLPG